MGSPEMSPESSEKPVLTLLEQIRGGAVKPSALNREQRQQCVEVLVLEGYSVSQIAQILNRSEKTIRRDLAEIRARNALTPSPELARMLIGALCMKSEAHQARLMRLARGTEGTVGERAQAESLAWQVARDTIKLLQLLGYLPLKPQHVVGSFVHHLGSDMGESPLEKTEETILEIETVAKEAGTLTPELIQHIQTLQRRLEQAKLNQEAQRLLEQQRQAPEQPEVDHVK